MSRIDELKKQHPHFNITYLDVFKRLDISKTGKYSPVISHMVNEIIEKRTTHRDELNSVKSRCEEYGFDYTGLNDYQITISYTILDYVIGKDWEMVREFMDFMERGIIDNKDVLTYKNMEDIRAAVSSASIKLYSKELESQVHKEFEDDTWLAVRPLSFEASMKYGASTKWCTTYKKEKEYFAKYFSRGVLVYFINKVTGYKFALYSEVYERDNEISFWNAEDARIDFLQLDIEPYLLPIIKNLAMSKVKNGEMLHPDDLQKVFVDCNYIELRAYSGEINLVEPANTLHAYEDVPRPMAEDERIDGNQFRITNVTNTPGYESITMNNPPYPDGYEDEDGEDEVMVAYEKRDAYMFYGNPNQFRITRADDGEIQLTSA